MYVYMHVCMCVCITCLKTAIKYAARNREVVVAATRRRIPVASAPLCHVKVSIYVRMQVCVCCSNKEKNTQTQTQTQNNTMCVLQQQGKEYSDSDSDTEEYYVCVAATRRRIPVESASHVKVFMHVRMYGAHACTCPRTHTSQFR